MVRMNPWILNYEGKNYGDGAEFACRLDCSLGVNTEPLPQAIATGLGALCVDTLKQYPHGDDFVDALVRKYRPLAPLTAEHIALGCGSADLMFAINKLFLSPGAVALGVAPQFACYVDDVHFSGGHYRPFLLTPQKNYLLEAEELVAYIENYPVPVQVIYVDNPNNPTGQVLTSAEVERLIQAAEKIGAAIILDEAYGDFMPMEGSAVQFIGKYDNLFVLKSMSKGYGMAGMRLGFVFSNPFAIGQIKKLIPQYNANALARELGRVMLEETPEYLADIGAKTASKTERIYNCVAGGPIHVAETASASPITLLYTERVSVDLCQVFQQVGLAVVSGASFEGLGVNTVRLMVPQEADMPLLLELLTQAQNILEP